MSSEVGRDLEFHEAVASLYLTLGTVPSYPKQCLPLYWHSKWIWGKATVGRAFLMVASLEKGEGTIQETPQNPPLALRCSACSGAGLLQFWSWKVFSEYSQEPGIQPLPNSVLAALHFIVTA